MSTDIEIIKDFLKQTDFVLLHEQVQTLTRLEEKLRPTDWESVLALDGVVKFISGLREQVVQTQIIPEQYVLPEPGKKIVTWPDCQVLMDHPDFSEGAELINDDYGLDMYGSSAYWVPDHILEQS